MLIHRGRRAIIETTLSGRKVGKEREGGREIALEARDSATREFLDFRFTHRSGATSRPGGKKKKKKKKKEKGGEGGLLSTQSLLLVCPSFPLPTPKRPILEESKRDPVKRREKKRGGGKKKKREKHPKIVPSSD